MTASRDDIHRLIAFNGIDGATGNFLQSPLTGEQLGRLAVQLPVGGALHQLLADWREGREVSDPFRAPISDVKDPKDLSQAGWGVIFAEDTPAVIRRALKPLLAHRRDQAGDLFKDLVFRSGQTHQQFMSEVGAIPGARAVPERLPYYLLLVGDPVKMPFRFQNELDVQYAVGRLHFDAETPEKSATAYASYAEAVVAVEDGTWRNRRQEVLFFAVESPGDEATRRTSGELVEPLAEVLRRSRPEWRPTLIGGGEATRTRLQQVLESDRPSILFTASHGVSFPNGSERQLEAQGALVCAEGVDGRSGRYFTAADVPDDAKLSGMIAFHFACYSAGTPELDEFGRISGVQGQIAPRPFVARLPQKLLEKGALAVIGHVDRTWTSSFSWNDQGGHVQVYSELLKQLTNGEPIGWAMEAMNSYFASQAASLQSLRDDIQFFRPEDFAIYADLWRQTVDAGSFVVLGDPAVRLNFD